MLTIFCNFFCNFVKQLYVILRLIVVSNSGRVPELAGKSLRISYGKLTAGLNNIT